MDIDTLLTETELRRGRAHYSYHKMAFNLETTKEEYLQWMSNEKSPNASQVKLMFLWVKDQLEIKDPPKGNKEEGEMGIDS